MAKTKIEVDLVVTGGNSVEQVETKVVSLKQQLKNLKEELASGTLTGEAFDKAAKKAGELQDRIGDVSQRVKNLASDSQKLDGFISLTQGIVGGFAAVQGITALVGEEDEELNKTLVKLQASMTALTGIQAVANTLNKDSAAITALTTIKTTAQAVANKFLTATTLESVAATNALRVALIASGIGVIIAVLYEAAKAMNLFGDSTKEAAEDLDNLAKKREEFNNTNIEKDNQDLARYARERDLAKARAKLAGATNAELLDIDRKYLLAKQSFVFQELQLDITNAKLRDEFEQANFELRMNSLAKQQAIEDARERKVKEVKKEEKKVEIQEKVDLKLREGLALYETELELWQREKDFKKQQAAEEEKERQEQIQAERDKQNAIISINENAFAILNNIAEIAIGEQYKYTKLGKILALAQIATDTALAISSLVRNSEGNPLNAPTGGIAGAAQFIAGIARITANIANAKRVLQGGGSPSGGSTGVSSQATGQAPPLKGFIPQGQTGSDTQRGTKVYVLEKDITDTQGRVARIKSNAELI